MKNLYETYVDDPEQTIMPSRARAFFDNEILPHLRNYWHNLSPYAGYRFARRSLEPVVDRINEFDEAVERGMDYLFSPRIVRNVKTPFADHFRQQDESPVGPLSLPMFTATTTPPVQVTAVAPPVQAATVAQTMPAAVTPPERVPTVVQPTPAAAVTPPAEASAVTPQAQLPTRTPPAEVPAAAPTAPAPVGTTIPQAAATAPLFPAEDPADYSNVIRDYLNRIVRRQEHADMLSSLAAYEATRQRIEPTITAPTIPARQTMPFYDVVGPGVDHFYKEMGRNFAAAARTLTEAGKGHMIPSVMADVQKGLVDMNVEAISKKAQHMMAHAGAQANINIAHETEKARIINEYKKIVDADRMTDANYRAQFIEAMGQFAQRAGQRYSEKELQEMYMDIMKGKMDRQKVAETVARGSLFEKHVDEKP